MEFDARSILVTGATSGIGRAAATLFARRGGTVGVNHCGDSAGFREMAESLTDAPGRLIELEADVRDAAAVQAMVDKLLAATGRIDVLVNNAGISRVKPFLETTEAEWDEILDTDLKSVFLCAKACLPSLLESRGAMVNIASELAFAGRANFAPYTAAKGGVVSLTRSLALEFAPRVRINAVAPGPTRTPFLEKELQQPGHDEPPDAIPLGRYAEPEEIAESILFLASERAGYFCGETISPNGGTLMR